MNTLVTLYAKVVLHTKANLMPAPGQATQLLLSPLDQHEMADLVKALDYISKAKADQAVLKSLP